MDLINRLLPDDCLIQILLYLPTNNLMRINEVCTRWREISPRVWREVKEIHFSKHSVSIPHSTQIQAHYIFDRMGCYLKRLEVSTANASKILYAANVYCHNLTELNIRLNNYDINEICKIISRMEKLQFLTLRMIHRVHVPMILQNLTRSVKHINFKHRSLYASLSTEFVQAFKPLDHIETLVLHNFHLDQFATACITQKKTLRYLNLENSVMDGPLLTTDFPNMEYLLLGELQFNPMDLLMNVTNKCKNLKCLSINECVASEQMLKELGKLKNLEALIMKKTPSLSDAVISKFNNLRLLNCSYCPQVTNAGIMKVLENCTNLKELNIVGTKVTSVVVEYADQVTNLRENKLVLHIFIHTNVMKSFVKEDMSSPFLVIKESKFYYEICGYSDESSQDSDESSLDSDDSTIEVTLKYPCNFLTYNFNKSDFSDSSFDESESSESNSTGHYWDNETNESESYGCRCLECVYNNLNSSNCSLNSDDSNYNNSSFDNFSSDGSSSNHPNSNNSECYDSSCRNSNSNDSNSNDSSSTDSDDADNNQATEE